MIISIQQSLYHSFSMTYQPKRGLFSQLVQQNHLKVGESPNKKLSFTSLSKKKQRHQEWASTHIVSPSVKSPNMLHSQVREIQSPSCLIYHNRENTSDEYRLFSNLLKNQINKQSDQRNGVSKNNLNTCGQNNMKKQEQQRNVDVQSGLNQEYYGLNFQMKEKKIEKERESKLGVRPESRQKVGKYFQGNPIIRPRSSNKQNNNNFNYQKMSNSIIKNQTKTEDEQSKNKEKKGSKNYDTFPPNQYYNNQGHQNIKRNIESTETEEGEKSMFDNVNTSTSSLKFDMSPFF